MTNPQINVGVLIAHSPASELSRMQDFSRRMVSDVNGQLNTGTGAEWIFHIEEPARLNNDDPRRPSDFLDEASLRMVEGPFDIVVVVTDVALVSRRHEVVAGLASPVSRVAVISTRKLLVTPRGRPVRSLHSESVRWNAAALLLHLSGHVLGIGHARDGAHVMAPFAFDESRHEVPRFDGNTRRRLEQLARHTPEPELVGGGTFRTLTFHLASAASHVGQVLSPVWRNRAPLLPLSLPSLATAAVVPTFILIFTAEIWDVGLNMTNQVAWVFTVISILAAVWYLTAVQNLFYPRKEKRVITQHMAVVNVVIFLTILFAILGLFVMVGLLMLFIEFYIFPSNLMTTWPTLEDPLVDTWDKVRLAAFISTVGVLTGALAGGLESRTVIRHLALFLDEP